MEPRPHERGNSASARSRSASTSFNGATSSRTWKPAPATTTPRASRGLQWSHVLTNVETTPRQQARRAANLASMEPRPHERGNPTSARAPTSCCRPLQWSHVLTNVETCGPRARCGKGTRSFNGATSSRTWKRFRTRQPPRRVHLASMEPRPHERGNPCWPRRTAATSLRFNGATSSRTWKRRRLLPPHRHRLGFNGATSSRTWKPIYLRDGFTCAGWLQWSHVLTNVETAFSRRRRGQDHGSFNGATSSRTWKPTPRRANSRTTLCFNGATSSRTWKRRTARPRRRAEDLLQWSHVLTNVETARPRDQLGEHTQASMEPRPHERGNPSPRATARRRPARLQWSHVLTNVETLPAELRLIEILKLQWSHVLTNVETFSRRGPRASTIKLQWSHVLTNVETPPVIASTGSTLPLQWSHVLTNVETARIVNSSGQTV